MSGKGHVPIRMCVGCRKRRKKGEMIRFTLSADGGAPVPGSKSGNGRGFYLCPDPSCLEAARKKRRINASIRLGHGQLN